MPRFPLADWRAEQLRLTVFTMPTATNRRAEWWNAITGSEPDDTRSNPKKGSGVISGAFGPGKLVLKWEPDRVDLLLAPNEPDLEAFLTEPEFSALGPAPEMLDVFVPLAERWVQLPDVPAIQRIAFGAVLLHPEPDRQSGYRRLPDYVPIEVDPESSDFLYQINLPAVPSDTGIAGLTLNRLSKWLVATIKFMPLRFTGVDIAVTQPIPITAYAFRLELDINTAPTFVDQIPPNRAIEVFRELVDAGRAIATNGVRP
jgi:hypothetical protein